MPSIVFYFHVHQPFRIKPYDMFSIGDDPNYFDAKDNRLDNVKILKKVSEKCYLPTNNLLLELLHRHPQFKVSFSITGVFLDQISQYAPEVLESFQKLVDTKKVELVSETYYHSLAFIGSKKEFIKQIRLQQKKLHDTFGVTPKAFRNTELIYNNEVAKIIEDLGFSTILAEGVDRYLGWRSPNFIYKPLGTENLRLLLKNYRLSDDIAFRFSDKNWSQWPLTAEKFVSWVNEINGNGHLANLFMDYETFGEHQWADTGIFDFLRSLPDKFLSHPDADFKTVSEAAHAYEVSDTIDMPEITSWADIERDLSAWLSNPLQHEALKAVYDLEDDVINTKDTFMIDSWRRLTTSDHFYYMCTKYFADGDVHKYFSPNETPYEAYKNYMNVLHDLRQRVYAKNS